MQKQVTKSDPLTDLLDLKDDKRILVREVTIIGQRLLDIESEFDQSSIDFNEAFTQSILKKGFTLTGIDKKQLKALARLAKEYRKLTKLFKKHNQDLVAIELEIITIKSF